MPQNYMTQQAAIPREKIRLKLEDAERGFYSNMFTQVNPEGNAELPSQKVVQFLMTSGVEVSKLREVWNIAARTSNDYLTKDEFYVALRLVAYLQNGIPANESSLRLNLKAANPRFDDFNRGTPGATSPDKRSPRGGAAAPSSLGLNIDALPSLDELDFSQPQQINPMIMGGN